MSDDELFAILSEIADEEIMAKNRASIIEVGRRIIGLAANGAEPVAWEIAPPAGERPALAFLTSKKPTKDHYAEQGWRVTPLYLAAPVADSAMAKDARLDALKRAGSRMANTMFNMAQRSGEELDRQLCEKLAQMQKEWDAALRAIAASAEKGDKA